MCRHIVKSSLRFLINVHFYKWMGALVPQPVPAPRLLPVTEVQNEIETFFNKKTMVSERNLTFLCPLCDQNEYVGNIALGHYKPVFVLKMVRMTGKVEAALPFCAFFPFLGVLCKVNSCISGEEQMDPMDSIVKKIYSIVFYCTPISMWE